MAPTAALPKATVKLAPTQAMARTPMAAPPSAPIKRAAAAESQQFYDEKDPEAGLVPLSVICMVVSLVLMAIQMMGSDRMFSSPPGSPSPVMVPQLEKVDWETKDAATGIWRNNFKKVLPDVPQ